MPGQKYSGTKTSNSNIHGLFTSRLTQSTIFPIGFFNGGTFLAQYPKFSRNKSNKDMLNLTNCIISRNHKFQQTVNIFLVLLYPGFSPGNAGTTKPKKARISCHFRRMPLSNGGHNLMYPKQNHNRSSFGSKLIQSTSKQLILRLHHSLTKSPNSLHSLQVPDQEKAWQKILKKSYSFCNKKKMKASPQRRKKLILQKKMIHFTKTRMIVLVFR